MKPAGKLKIWVWACILLLGGPAAWARAAGPELADTVALHAALRTAQADTTRIRLLTALSHALHNEQPARALHYGLAAVRAARALPPARQDQPLLAALLVVSSCYANLSNGPQALHLLSEAERLARRRRDDDALTAIYTKQGSIFHERGDSTTAWHHYRRGLRLADQPTVRVPTRMRLYGNVGSLLAYRQRFAGALRYDSLALGLARYTQDSTAEANYLASLGTLHLRRGNKARAGELIMNALAISRQQHAVRNEANQLLLLGLYYYETDQPVLARSTTREGLAVARRSQFQERVLDAYSLLGTLAADRADYRRAYEWGERYRDLNDTLNSRQMLRALAATQANYENQARVRRIQDLTQRNNREETRSRLLLVAVGLLVLVLAVGISLFFRLRRSRADLARSNAALQQAADELRGVARFKDRLYAIVAHDMRGPVMAFAGVTSMIDTYVAQNNQAELTRLSGLVRQAADSLNHLLDNVLNWAVSQTGELACRPEPLLVADLFAECLALYQSSITARGQHISTTVPPDLYIVADRNMTRTILRNLVSNALKFEPTGGLVLLGAQADPADAHMALLSCTDNGPGMSAATIERVLGAPAGPQPGDQTSAATGLGLGLALCRAFVHRQGGTLTIQSREGVGTHVQVTLPVQRARA